jgi:hypothetical protein
MAVKIVEMCDRCKREVFEVRQGNAANYDGKHGPTSLLKSIAIESKTFFLCVDCTAKVMSLLGEAKRK